MNHEWMYYFPSGLNGNNWIKWENDRIMLESEGRYNWNCNDTSSSPSINNNDSVGKSSVMS